jgi:tRNA (guanine37-N1)-methyltransferase
MKVPQALFSGDHRRIAAWRRKKAMEKTWLKRPDLLEAVDLSPEEEAALEEVRREQKERKTS